MKSFTSSLELDSLRLNRLLRKSSVDAAVLTLKVVVALLAIILLLLFIQEGISGFLNTRRAVSQLDEQMSSSTALAAGRQQVARGEAQVDYAAIVNSKIFGQLGVQSGPTTPVAAKPVSTIALELIGTFLSDGQAPYAIIEDKKKKTQDVFVLKDMIFGEAKLVAILTDRVEIERNGKIEVLKLDDAPDTSGEAPRGGVSATGENQFAVDEAELDTALQNLPLLLTQARAVPYFREGRAIGLRMFAIRSGSLFEKVGLRNGDILKSINGNSLADLSQAMKLFERLKEERSLSVTLERNNEETEFKYQIK